MVIKSSNIFENLQVSRETIDDLSLFKEILIKNNSKFNLISKNDEKIIDIRHIYDSAQIVDMFDKNTESCADLGTGAGFPGIILAILTKHKDLDIRFMLYEKSIKKTNFLNEIINKFSLNASVVNKNIIDLENLKANTITARAFKPIDQIFNIIKKNFIKYENLILFLGKNGKQALRDTSKVWDFEYKERRSLTNNDSLIVNVKNIKKKN